MRDLFERHAVLPELRKTSEVEMEQNCLFGLADKRLCQRALVSEDIINQF